MSEALGELVYLESLNGNGASAELALIDPAGIVLRDIEWLLENFVQADTFNLLQGHGGTNKGTWTCHLAAQATRGELTGAPMMVLFASAEDDIQTVLLPR